jgi:hypothetical protein
LCPRAAQHENGEGTAAKLHSCRQCGDPGQVEEIIPQQIPSGRGELYVVRFTAEDDGTTNIQLFSTLNGLDKRVEEAMSPCLQGSGQSKVKANQPKVKAQ